MREKDRRAILNIEKALGFKWRQGLSRQTSLSCTIPVIKTFLNDVDCLKKNFVDLAPNELRASQDFEYSCQGFFQHHGPILWPSLSENRSDWLVDAETNDWGGLYPRDLTYQNPKHREELRQNFEALLLEKCIRYYGNQMAKTLRSGSTFDLREESPDSEVEHISEPSREHDDFSDGDSIYVLPQERPRTQGFRAVNPRDRLEAGVRSRGEPPSSTQFMAPVAQMVRNIDEKRPSLVFSGYGGKPIDKNTRNMLGRVDLSPNRGRYEQPDPQTGKLFDISRESSPDSVPYRLTIDTSGQYAVAGHKHSRSADSEYESTPRKMTKSSQVRDQQQRPLVTLKLDPTKLAAIVRQPRSLAKTYPVARKRPASGCNQPIGDPESSDEADIEAPTFSSLATSHEGPKDFAIANDSPSLMLAVEDEHIMDYADLFEDAQVTAVTPSRLEPGREVVRSKAFVGTGSPFDHPPDTPLQTSEVQPPANAEDAVHVMSGGTHYNEIERSDASDDRGNCSEQPNASYTQHTLGVVNSANDTVLEKQKSVSVDTSMSGIPNDQSSTDVSVPQVNDISGVRSESNHDSIDTTSLPQRATTTVDHETTNLHLSPTSPNTLNSVPTPATSVHHDAASNLQCSNPPDMAEESKVDSDVKSDAKLEAPTALERVRTKVFWDTTTDCPNNLPLRRCYTHREFFNQLLRRKPSEFEHRKIQAVEVRLTNAEAAGITDSPNCTILADDDEDAFEDLIETLRGFTASVRPELRVMVKFHKE